MFYTFRLRVFCYSVHYILKYYSNEYFIRIYLSHVVLSLQNLLNKSSEIIISIHTFHDLFQCSYTNI